MEKTEMRLRYFNTLGVGLADKTADDLDRRRAALDRAHELRALEINLFWTRATYFFLAQAAIFAATGYILNAQKGDYRPLAIALTILGLFTAWLGRLAGEGSKFWQQNWENHIDLLEDEFEGALHKTVWLVAGARQYSVSRIHIMQAWALTCFWWVALVFVTAKAWCDRAPETPLASALIVTAFGSLPLILGIAWATRSVRTKLSGARLTDELGKPSKSLEQWELEQRSSLAMRPDLIVKRRSAGD